MLFLLVVTVLLAWLLTRPFYWWQRGVPSVLPLPLLGNFLSAIYLSNKDFFDSFYYKFPKSPYVGMYFLTRPVLLLSDPQVIMEVLEEKATSFASHGVYVSRKRDILAKSVFHIDGEDWKLVRSKLSPHFSPAKVKTMLQVGKGSIDRLMEEFESQVQDQEQVVEVSSLAMFLTVDMTAGALFGLQTPIFQERTESEFYLSAKDLNTPGSMIKMFVSLVSPSIYEMCRFTSFTQRANSFLVNMIHSAVKARQNNEDAPKNLMDGLMMLNEINSKVYDEEFLISQGALMWTGGVETTADTLGFALYELAKNKSLQDELRGKLRTSQGEILLKAVITETLRKYPIFGLLTRRCTQKCKLSTGLNVEQGTLLMIPVLSIHADSKLYPNPEEFQPGRDAPKGAFLAFGSGPRTCMGIKFGYAALEEIITTLLEKYEFSPSAIPMIIEPKTFFTTPKGGIWLKVRQLQT